MKVKPETELAVLLARHISPKVSSSRQICLIAGILRRIAARHARSVCWYCNGMTDAGKAYAIEDYDRDCADRMSEAAAALAHTGLRAVFTGDPRGCTLRLFSTTRKSFPCNTCGGAESGYGVL